MKISRREVESGPIRWLIRISGWFSLAVGLSQFVIPVNSPFSYYSYIENPLLIGIVLIVLDLLLPDPVRNARKQRKKLAKLYGVQPENVFVSNGSDEVLNFAFRQLSARLMIAVQLGLVEVS